MAIGKDPVGGATKNLFQIYPFSHTAVGVCDRRQGIPMTYIILNTIFRAALN